MYSLLCRSEVKHNFDDSEKDTRKTWKSKTQLQSKVGNQGVGLQIHCRGLGSPTHTGADQVSFSGCGFPHGRIPVLHLGTRGENQNLMRKCLQTVFKYRLPSTSLSFGNVDDRERTERRFNWMIGIVELQRVRYNWVTEHTHRGIMSYPKGEDAGQEGTGHLCRSWEHQEHPAGRSLAQRWRACSESLPRYHVTSPRDTNVLSQKDNCSHNDENKPYSQ